jgi:hypothetical protein
VIFGGIGERLEFIQRAHGRDTSAPRGGWPKKGGSLRQDVLGI